MPPYSHRCRVGTPRGAKQAVGTEAYPGPLATIFLNLFFELILRNILAHFIGRNVRFYFFKLINIPKTKEQLTQGISKTDSISQNVLNALVGIITISAISILVAYIIYS